MNGTETERPDADAAEVAAWRLEQLLRAGYERQAATLLAERRDVDLHLATQLLSSGCPAETALRILL